MRLLCSGPDGHRLAQPADGVQEIPGADIAADRRAVRES